MSPIEKVLAESQSRHTNVLSLGAEFWGGRAFLVQVNTKGPVKLQ